MSTLKAQVRDFLIQVYPDTWTNGSIARRLFANEPSVRRITRELASAGIIREVHGGFGSLPIEYAANAAASQTRRRSRR